MYEAFCPSCGAKTRIATGQQPPRCKHCWTALVPVGGGSQSPEDEPARSGAPGLAELLSKGRDLSADVDRSPTGMLTCGLCGMFVEPRQFCSDCGAPLPRVAA
jgi:rRNA maturation endonuclease Nob1